MSNFTTFFPAAGGVGGGGINSYAPFKVADTGNPVGYDATTGLYTNPVDESVWLKTGFTLSGVEETYPNATINNTGVFYTGFVFSASVTYGAGTNYTNGNIFTQTTFPGVVTEYTSAGVATGFTFTAGNNPRGVCFVGGNYYVLTATNGTVTEYTSAGVATGFTFNAGISTDSSIGNNATNLILIDSVNDLAVEYTTAGVATGLSFSVATNVNNETGITWDSNDNQYWVSTDVGTVINFDAAGNRLNTTIPTIATTGRARGELMFNASNNTIGVSNRTTSQIFWFEKSDSVVGDATARTDSSGSAQPLFIKLK